MGEVDEWFDSLIGCAMALESFTTDEVIAEYSRKHGEPDSSKPVGGAIVKATMAGFIERTSEIVQGKPKGKSLRGEPKRVYRSKMRPIGDNDGNPV